MKSTRKSNFIDPLKNNKGFTLLELIMVIIILGVLSSIAVDKFTDLRAKSLREAAVYDNAVRAQKLERDIAIRALIASNTVTDTTDPLFIKDPEDLPAAPQEFIDEVLEVPGLVQALPPVEDPVDPTPPTP